MSKHKNIIIITSQNEHQKIFIFVPWKVLYSGTLTCEDKQPHGEQISDEAPSECSVEVDF